MDSINSVLTILFMIALGLFIRHKGFLDENTINKLTKLALSLTVPSLLFKNSYQQFTKEFFIEAKFSLILPLGILLCTYFLGMLVAKVFKIKDIGLFSVMFGLSNAVFIGLPINQAIFGDAAVAYVTMYFFCNTIIFWTLGVMGISRDGGSREKFSIRQLKKVFSMPMLGFICGTLLSLFGVPLPGFVLSAANYIGSMTTPLTMLLTGAIIYGVKETGLKLPKESMLVCCGRFIAAPLLTFTACYLLLPHGAMISKVFLLESGMPVMTQALLLARNYKANSTLAALTISLTTILCLLFVPLLTFVSSFV